MFGVTKATTWPLDSFSDICLGIIRKVTSSYVGVGHRLGVGHGKRDYFLGYNCSTHLSASQLTNED